MQFNALVTGGGGFLGSAIVQQLLKRGATVRSFSRQEHLELRKWGVQQVKGDLGDLQAILAAAKGCNIIFHVGAKAGIWGPYADYHRTNVVGTENIIAACRQQGISRLVYTSSPSVVFNGRDMEGIDETTPYPEHFETHYPKTKAMAERLVLAANSKTLATVSLRPHLIWGSGDNHLLPRLAAKAKAGQLRRIGRENKLIDTVYIDNAAEAHVLAAERLEPGAAIGGRPYFISQGEPVETWTMINRLLEAAGAPPVTKTVPAGLALALAWGFEALHRVTNNPKEPRLTRFVVKELCTSHWFNIDAARRDLGYNPQINLAEGLRRLKQHYQG